MKLTPQPHVDPPKDDLFLLLGPPPELFTRCEQTFIVKVDEMLWPNGIPVTAEQVNKWLYQGWGMREATITVAEVDI